jgi:hypothetical protein
LTLSNSNGIVANVMAPSYFGNISAPNGPIAGIIQAIGLYDGNGHFILGTGDLGKTVVTNVQITGVTSITAAGALSGQIIVGGNLVSSITVNAGFSGIVAVQGNFGAFAPISSMNANKALPLTRFGGMLVNGGLSGKFLVLGNTFGDITINGGLAGRIAVEGGQAIATLDPSRKGILGNLSVNGSISADILSSGAIISAGEIGDVPNGTTFSRNGADKGIIAAEGNINLGAQSGSVTTPPLVNVASSSSSKWDGGYNKKEIDYIFASGTTPLALNDLNGQLDDGLNIYGASIGPSTNSLSLMLNDLAALKLDSNGNLTGLTS